MEIQETKIPLIKNVLALIRVMEETCVQLFEILFLKVGCCNDESIEIEDDCQILFNDLTAGISGLINCQEELNGYLSHACYKEMTYNLDFCLCSTISQINNDQIQEAAKLLKYQFRPFLQELWEELYYWGMIYPDTKKMTDYYRDEFASHHASLYIPKNPTKYKYKISFFIPVYNKLDYTQQCISSILANTDLKKYSCEFILLNDGSTDHSQEYLEELDLGVDKKIIYLRKNVKTMIFSLALRVCEGEYLLFVNNDTVVTRGWLDNLLLCVESDPSIISATPCTPNTSNLQIDLDERYPFSSLAELNQYRNQSNPSLWEERARIMPVIALYKTDLINRIGLADRLFYTMEFWDDDFSLRARRSGYKQILCRDTYCYHFGSVTGKDAQLKENTLEKGRALFLKKNQVDAWGHDFCYDYQSIALIKSTLLTESDNRHQTSSEDLSMILDIDGGFGDTLLQIKNIFRTAGKKSDVYSICSDNRYSADLKNVSDHHCFSNNAAEAVKKLNDKSFHLIHLSMPLEHYTDSVQLLVLLHSKLKERGLLLFQVTNLYYKPFLESFLSLSFPDGRDSVHFLNISFLQNHLRNLFSQMDCIAQTESVPGLEDFISIHMKGLVNSSSELLLSSRYLKFCCRK